MPRIWKPKTLGLYRVAAPAIALFRALLTQSRAATALDDAARSALQNIVRNRFRANQHLVSVRHTKVAYMAGYHGLDLLDACVDACPDATAKIRDLLSRTPVELTQPAPPPLPRKSKEQQWRERSNASARDAMTLASPPPGSRLVDRWPRPADAPPLPRGPYFVQTNGIPFLRLKKPQPPVLSRLLRNRITQKQARLNKLGVLRNYYLPLAELEDRWDAHLRAMGVGDADAAGRSETWVAEFARQSDELSTAMREMTERHLETAKKMWSIVEDERTRRQEHGRRVQP